MLIRDIRIIACHVRITCCQGILPEQRKKKDSLGEVFKVQSQYETRNYEVIP